MPLPVGRPWRNYFFGTEAISDCKVGSSLVFQGDWEGKTCRDKGTILAVETEKFLQYDYWSGFSGLEELPENYSIVTYRPEPEGTGTTIRITQQGFTGEEARSHSDAGWGKVLDNLKNLLEGQ
jgi:uncharacterized protein YndB with AHSA1/START domain